MHIKTIYIKLIKEHTAFGSKGRGLANLSSPAKYSSSIIVEFTHTVKFHKNISHGLVIMNG